jgi:hypothetical protein
MTAQVAILNRTAVALASDSAVTISGDKLNIYQTVNKLFTASKYEPVGVMVYGSADLMGVPWESTVKLFRKSLGPTKYRSLHEYGDALVAFLQTNRTLFPEAAQEMFVQVRASELVSATAEGIIAIAKEKIDAGEQIVASGAAAIAAEVIAGIAADWEGRPRLTCFSAQDDEALQAKYGDVIAQVIGRELGALSLPSESVAQLTRAVVSTFTRDRFLRSSGIVLAGFGDEEVFPSVDELVVEAVIGDRLKHRRRRSSVAEVGAMIIPFAQRKMVDAFLQGIHPDYSLFLESYLERVFGEYHAGLTANIDALDAEPASEISGRIQAAGRALLDDLRKARAEYSRANHVDAKLGTIQVLPKQELAEMAEALVNLTSFEQRLSGSAETVGGPIDVAVISKGDGFIWIKRKHYFKAELNPFFVANYMRENND